MRTLKFNVAFAVAIITIMTTLATKANFLGPKVITRCFETLGLGNASCILTITIHSSSTPRVTCAEAQSVISAMPYVRIAAVALSLPDASTCTGSKNFCCAKLTEINASDPGYACAEFLDLGEGFRKYKVASLNDVFCKQN